MGKVLILGIFFISAIFIIIILSVQSETGDSREGISINLTEIQAKALCREALNYGIKKVKDAGSSADSVTYTQTFVDYEVGGGIIDRIEYTAIGDTMKISSYASYQNGNNTFHHKSTAFVTWALATGSAAIVANGEINVGGNATVDGGILPNLDPPLDFEAFFGMTKVQMQAIADNDLVDPHNNPGGVSGVTYVTFSGAFPGTFRVTNPSWVGNGILVVDGDVELTGGTFTGVMWVVGRLRINGVDGFSGAIYVEGLDAYGEIQAVPLLGTCVISYEEGVIDSVMSTIGITNWETLNLELKVISMFEDD